MRHINREEVRARISPEWLQDAAKALEEVRCLPPEERAKAIDDRSHIWKALKNELYKISHGKCWYCETKDVRHDDEIDHWRPKNAVYECKEHPGYWWLAFDWENLRYVCVFCNQKRNYDKSGNKDEGGKGTCFPLVKEEKRIFEKCHPMKLLDEEPILLDPMVRRDTQMLRFEIDGTVHPRKSKEESSIEYCRAYKSIIIYHLDANDLAEKRRTAVCNHIKRLIDEGNAYYYCLSQPGGDPTALKAYRSIIDQLSLMIEAQFEYSMAARSVIFGYRTTYSWLNEVLDEAY